MGTITVIGTSHIARQSLREVRLAIEEGKPDIIAVELDRKRLPALFDNQRSIRLSDMFRVGIKGYLFALLGAWAGKRLGEHVGATPGQEMKLAISLARKQKIPVALIDQDIEITLRKLSASITWKEKWNFVVDVLKSPFVGPQVNFDLSTVPEKQLIKHMMETLRKRYPNLYRVLIDDRNTVMVRRIAALVQQHPEKNILVIVGAGHADDIRKRTAGNALSAVSYSLPKGMMLTFS